MKRKQEIKLDYIIDSILKVKIKRFNEDYTSTNEVETIKQLMEQRFIKKTLTVNINNMYSNRRFNTINNVIIQKNNDELDLSKLKKEIREIIYDEQFVFLCLCKIIINKIVNSIEPTCLNCSRECSGDFSYSQDFTCFNWKYDIQEENQKKLRFYL